MTTIRKAPRARSGSYCILTLGSEDAAMLQIQKPSAREKLMGYAFLALMAAVIAFIFYKGVVLF